MPETNDRFSLQNQRLRNVLSNSKRVHPRSTFFYYCCNLLAVGNSIKGNAHAGGFSKRWVRGFSQV